MGQRGRVKKIQAGQHAVLREIVVEKPLATLEEVGAEFTRRTGISVHSATLTKGLREAGRERRRGPREGLHSRKREPGISFRRFRTVSTA